MATLHSLIADNVYLGWREEYNRWVFTPYWQGEPMKDFVPDTYYCRALYTFYVGSRRYLMKIDKSPAFIQCPNELTVYSALLKEHKRYFVPIMHGNNGVDGSPPFIISPWVPNLVTVGATVTYDCPLAYQQAIINDISHNYRLRDLRFNKNWYIHNGRPLIVDYGCMR